MALESLAAVSLVGNIIQFIEIGAKTISIFREIQQNVEGHTRTNEESELIAKDLKGLLDVLSKNSTLRNDSSWSQINEKCSILAQELITTLDALKPSQKSGKRIETLKVSFKVLLKQGKTRNLETRIWKLRDELCFRLNTLLLLQRTELSESMGDIGSSLKDWKDATDKKIDALVQNLSEVERFNSRRINKDAMERAEESFHQFAEAFKVHIKETQDETRVRRILQSLYFKQLRARESEIRDSHGSTLQWIFNEPVSRTRLVSWLRDSNDIYWISGKAGSGKSTLMKFLVGHEKTIKLLREWARPKELILATQFFWSSGTYLQKSQEGLFRTLLFQILLRRPDLTAVACENRWNSGGYGDMDSWTLSELTQSFRALSDVELGVRICLFVDGLDEYRGDQEELVKILRIISSSPVIKICASSRPWIPFLKAFERSSWKLAVQDLTKNDILEYVKDNLESSQRFRDLHKYKRKTEDSLILQITSRAQGVFLWVYLVVRSLLKGLDNCDSLSLLQQRLDDLPDDLEAYFRLILDSIEGIYMIQSCRVFQTLVQATSSLPVIAFYFLSLESNQPGYALKPTEFTSDKSSRLLKVEHDTRRQLIAQCSDLVHITFLEKEEFPWQYSVGFLHRTVADFLQTKDMAKLLVDRAGKDFDPRRSLCRACFAILKVPSSKSGLYLKSYVRGLVASIMHNAYEIETLHGESQVAILDALDSTILRYRGLDSGWEDVANDVECGDILHLAIRCRMVCYLREKFVDKNKSRPALLKDALKPGLIIENEVGFRADTAENIDLRLAEMVIRFGTSPNHLLPEKKVSVWEDFLTTSLNTRDIRSQWDMTKFLRTDEQTSQAALLNEDHTYEICRLMVANGADELVSLSLVGDKSYNIQEEKFRLAVPVGTVFDDLLGRTRSKSLMAIYAERHRRERDGLSTCILM